MTLWDQGNGQQAGGHRGTATVPRTSPQLEWGCTTAQMKPQTQAMPSYIWAALSHRTNIKACILEDYPGLLDMTDVKSKHCQFNAYFKRWLISWVIGKRQNYNNISKCTKLLKQKRLTTQYCEGSWRNGSFIHFMLLKTNCKQTLATLIAAECMHPYSPMMHFSILALRTPWKVWKDKKIWHWKMNSPGQ